MAIERLLSGSIQERIEELLRPEDLIMEAARDLVKDEIKIKANIFLFKE